ncbi:DNA mismatch repair protein MutS [Paenibacillus sp. YPG26]|uniref:endonuclease MutS2 n=1 Tax=Paenibacillus sp. YPG26 TaxID=2878915 RepID=UPI00203F32B4|nr:DNA mismatch repair protein MutS [Paenibacillus sp. YPG26]USB33802.1 DNA mismatch repair protein MutS [Paenibacillus sp. YPG26]
MQHYTLNTLEYDQIKQDIMTYAVSYAGREMVSSLEPTNLIHVIRRSMQETLEARLILEKGSSIPLPSLDGIEQVVSLLGTGYLFGEEDLMAVYTFLHSCTQLRKYMDGKRELAPEISSYSASLRELPDVQKEILRCIRHGRVTDEASRELAKARQRMNSVRERIQKKIQGIMSRYQTILQESLVSVRNGRYVIPLKKEYYRQVKGSVLDYSTSGQTVFVEPYEISGLQAELELLQGDESREEAKVLSMLSDMVEQGTEEIRINIKITGTYDFIFAKARHAVAIGGQAVELSEEGQTRLLGARHPKLLQNMVPLDIEIGKSFRTLIITGPNTGGKTVVLKTLGLLTLMVQSGLLVPVLPGSRFGVYSRVMAVIGDGQSIEQSLSTFSAQITSLVGMLAAADSRTLLLIDELAAGTDPGEGIALSTAILEELSGQGASVLVTTHFNELKVLAARTPGFENARMEFDPVSLRPLYRLTIGQAGQSYAIEIADKLGIPAAVLDRSRALLYKQPVRAEGERYPDDREGPEEWRDPVISDVGSEEQVGSREQPARNVSETGTGRIEDGVGRTDARAGGTEAATGRTKAGTERAEAITGRAESRTWRAEEVSERTEAGTEREEAINTRLEKDHSDQAQLPGAQEEREASADPVEQPAAPRRAFEIGDAVKVTSLGKVGIVYEAQDRQGMVGVMVQKQKMRVNHKRLKPYISKEELYPDDYDFDIVFETKENRKKKKVMRKRHVEGMTIIHQPDQDR